MTNSQFTKTATPASIRRMTDRLIDFLRKQQGTDVLIHVDGGIEDNLLRKIEQTTATVTGRRVSLVCREMGPIPGDNERIWLVGIVDES